MTDVNKQLEVEQTEVEQTEVKVELPFTVQDNPPAWVVAVVNEYAKGMLELEDIQAELKQTKADLQRMKGAISKYITPVAK